MPKFDISNEELNNLIKEKSTGMGSLVNNFDASNLSSLNVASDALSQMDKIRNDDNKLLKSMKDMMGSYTHSIISAKPNWQKIVEPSENYPAVPKIISRHTEMIKPLENQLKATQNLNKSIMEQNIALHEQSDLIKQQLVESQKANALKEKELEDGKKSSKTAYNLNIAILIVALLTLVVTCFSEYNSLNTKTEAQHSDEKLAPSENIIPLEKNEQLKKDTVAPVLKHKQDTPLSTDDVVITKDEIEKSISK